MMIMTVIIVVPIAIISCHDNCGNYRPSPDDDVHPPTKSKQ